MYVDCVGSNSHLNSFYYLFNANQCYFQRFIYFKQQGRGHWNVNTLVPIGVQTFQLIIKNKIISKVYYKTDKTFTNKFKHNIFSLNTIFTHF